MSTIRDAIEAGELHPVGDRVWVGPVSDDKIQEKSPGGLFLPPSQLDKQKESWCLGEIVALGDACELALGLGGPLAPGLRVIVPMFRYEPLKIAGLDPPLRVYGEDDILGVLQEAK